MCDEEQVLPFPDNSFDLVTSSLRSGVCVCVCVCVSVREREFLHLAVYIGSTTSLEP